jgi:hypothetical protein
MAVVASRGGALMVLRSRLAGVVEIIGGRRGLPGFLVGGGRHRLRVLLAAFRRPGEGNG